MTLPSLDGRWCHRIAFGDRCLVRAGERYAKQHGQAEAVRLIPPDRFSTSFS
jgi:hypothetical protein